MLRKVSCTVSFDPEAEGRHLARALEIFQYQLKVRWWWFHRGAAGEDALRRASLSCRA